MKILVFDVAAERGGALSVLQMTHAAALRESAHEWVFVVSKPQLAESMHVKNRRFPQVKRSWFHRLYFDLFTARKIAREEGADIVLSLQNLTVPGVRQRQIVYLHNSLAFTNYRFDLIKSPRLWLYQRVISWLIRRSVRAADHVVVQAPWIRDAVVKAFTVEPDQISVIRPITTQKNATGLFQPTAENRHRFIYPADGLPYKNHSLLFEALERLERDDIMVDVVCTITPRNLKALGIRRIPESVRLVGQLPFEAVQRAYTDHVLVFPSVLETVGLPLVEALSAQTFVLAPAMDYARDVLMDYENAYYFDPLSSDSLYALMTRVLDGSIPHSSVPGMGVVEDGDPWDQLVRKVVSV